MENRQTFNYHTHTKRCGHAANEEDEEYVIKAIASGFQTLGFSDHGPYRHYSLKTDRMDYDEIEDYIGSIHSLKEKYKDQIRILQGFEFEYFDEMVDELNDLSKKADYLILGQHYPTPSAKLEYTVNCGSKELIERYGYQVTKGIETGKFLYVAHPDYFCGSIVDFDDTCVETAKRICDSAQKHHIPLEVNIKFDQRRGKEFSNGFQLVYPLRQFWQVAQDYDIECIYGFDAHNPSTLTHLEFYSKADEILKGLNLHFVTKELI